MNQTANYGLSQWEAADRVQRADFNADNSVIDAALKALSDRIDAAGGAKIATGHYVGTGTYGEDAPTTLCLDFRASAVLIFPVGSHRLTLIMLRKANGVTSYTLSPTTNSSFDPGYAAQYKWSGNTVSLWSTTKASDQCNAQDYEYLWIAI